MRNEPTRRAHGVEGNHKELKISKRHKETHNEKRHDHGGYGEAFIQAGHRSCNRLLSERLGCGRSGSRSCRRGGLHGTSRMARFRRGMLWNRGCGRRGRRLRRRWNLNAWCGRRLWRQSDPDGFFFRLDLRGLSRFRRHCVWRRSRGIL